MLHTKFQGNRPSGSGEDVSKIFTIYIGMTAILVMWSGTIKTTFPPLSGGCIVISEKTSFENVDEGRTTEATTL